MQTRNCEGKKQACEIKVANNFLVFYSEVETGFHRKVEPLLQMQKSKSDWLTSTGF